MTSTPAKFRAALDAAGYRYDAAGDCTDVSAVNGSYGARFRELVA